MSNLSDRGEFLLASHIFGSGTFAKPTVIAIAACNVVPVDSDTGALTGREVANSGAYARQTLNPSAVNWTDPVGVNGICYNLGTITFPVATASWGWVSGVAICDSATFGAGNHLIWGALTTSKLIDTNDQLIIAPSGIAITFA